MNRLPIFFFLISILLIKPLHLVAQDGSPFNLSGPKVTPEIVISEIIRYPNEAAKARKEGRVVYQIEIDSSSNYVSSTLFELTHPAFKEESQKAMNYLEASWYPELLGSKAPGESYLVVMTFANLNLQVDPIDRLAQANRLIKKGKPGKAIPILNRLIDVYPYGKEYYETRAKAFARMGNNDEFQSDTEKIVNLEKTVLANLTTFIYSTRSRVPISW